MRPTVFTVRRIAVAAAAVAAVAVAGPAMAQESHSASVTSSKAAPPCQSSGIDDWLDTNGNGKTIHAVLGIVDTGNFPTSACKPVTAAGLEVFAPVGINEVGRTVPFPFSACSTRGSHAPNFLSVTPVQPGA